MTTWATIQASALQWSPSGALYVAGFTDDGGSYLARVDEGELEMVEGDFDGGILQIDVASDDDIVVVGSFTNVGSVPAAHVARWDGAAWQARLSDGSRLVRRAGTTKPWNLTPFAKSIVETSGSSSSLM